MKAKTNRTAALPVGESVTAALALSGRDRLGAVFARLRLPVVATIDQVHNYDDILVAGYVFDERMAAEGALKSWLAE